MAKTETAAATDKPVTIGVDIANDRVEYQINDWSRGGELIAGSSVAGPDVVESTLSEVLVSRLASCSVAHLQSEATACAEAVKVAFETLRATPAEAE